MVNFHLLTSANFLVTKKIAYCLPIHMRQYSKALLPKTIDIKAFFRELGFAHRMVSWQTATQEVGLFLLDHL